MTPQTNIVDCACVLSLDCAALGALVRVLKRLRASDAAVTLRVVNVHTRLSRRFEMTSLSSVFDIAFRD